MRCMGDMRNLITLITLYKSQLNTWKKVLGSLEQAEGHMSHTSCIVVH